MRNTAAKQPTLFPGFPPTHRSRSVGMGRRGPRERTKLPNNPQKLVANYTPPFPLGHFSSQECIILAQK